MNSEQSCDLPIIYNIRKLFHPVVIEVVIKIFHVFQT
jgi:hypothetical protein